MKFLLLGTRLIALSGLRTRTVRIADKLKFSETMAYSIVLLGVRDQEKKFNLNLIINSKLNLSLPSNDNNKIESIPRLGHVRILAKEAHGAYFYHHFNEKKRVNHMIQIAQDGAPR